MTLPNPAAVPLDQPLYDARFRQAVGRFFRKYATFQGRAGRAEYWWVVLFVNLLMLVAMVPYVVAAVGQIVSTIGYSIEASQTGTSSVPYDLLGWTVGLLLSILPLLVVSFGVMVPTYALGVRRLHDVGMSGWFVLLSPVTGGVFMFVIGFLPAKAEGLRFEDFGGSPPVIAPGLFVPPAPMHPGGPMQPAPYGMVGQPFAYAQGAPQQQGS